jgi:two-component system chemotaxis sensor kinase CheA
MVDCLFQCLDALQEYVTNIQQNQDEGTNDNEPIIKMLNAFINGGGAAPAPQAAAAAAPAGDAAPASSSASAGTNYSEYNGITLADFEKNAVNEALKKGLHVYMIKVSVDENCVLKAARAFLVFKNLEGHCDIIKSEPSVQDIEDEKFDFDFSIVVISSENFVDITKIIKNVSEIKDAVGEEITTPFPEEETVSEEEAKPAEKAAETKPAEVKKDAKETKPAAAAGGKQQPAAAAGKSKPVGHTVRVDIEKLDVLMNLVSELIIAKNGLVSASTADENGETSVNQSFNEQIEYLERVTTNLHESVMKVRMMPIESVVSKFPRMIRDLTKKLNKPMELYMSGEDTELDRTVIDEIGDPLMHLLRNSADHGIESAEVRAERGKDPTGSIWLNAYQDGNNVVIEVKDDGNGIDVEKVRNKAIEKGTITEEQAAAMTEDEIVGLLFRPSFSTADKVTDVSGRGVGLDVVKSKIEALGGDVEVKTVYGQGSTFIIRLPLTLAIIQALMVKLGDEKFAISLGSIQTIEDIPVSEIKYVHAKEVIHLRGSVIPLIRLRELLDVPGECEDQSNITVVIVSKGDKLAGLVVDSLIGQMEIVIKSLGKYININKMISGATILGDGSVALIIDANTLV